MHRSDSLSTSYHNGVAGSPALEVTFASPTGLQVTTGAATVKAPGPPGSIETGPEEKRGYVLRAVAPAATSIRFDVTLRIIAPQR